MSERNRMRKRRSEKPTGVCHVEQSTGSVALYTHILRAGQPRQRDERARLGDLRLVVVWAHAMNNVLM